MPQFDGTGPMGSGSKTGRGLGPCKTGKTPGRMGRGRGFFGRVYGSKRNWSNEDLTDYKKELEEELERINQSLNK